VASPARCSWPSTCSATILERRPRLMMGVLMQVPPRELSLGMNAPATRFGPATLRRADIRPCPCNRTAGCLSAGAVDSVGNVDGQRIDPEQEAPAPKMARARVFAGAAGRVEAGFAHPRRFRQCSRSWLRARRSSCGVMPQRRRSLLSDPSAIPRNW
jgi:hypothetical protein